MATRTKNRRILERVLYLTFAACLVLSTVFGMVPRAGADVEITPSTQPATTIDGVVVQPAPHVKVTDQWTPTAVITVATVIVGLIAGTLIPALIAWRKSGENSERLDRQGARVSDLEKKSPPPPPGGV